MERTTFEGFSIEFPPGWTELHEDGTFSDPTEGERRMFGRPGSPGVVVVSMLHHPADAHDTSLRDHAGELARSWGRARGIESPLTIASQARTDGALACAEYRLAGEYVAVWYLTNEEITLQASYMCSWKLRDEERAVREKLIASMTFS
ncbi:MAG: hypothetical protein U0441_37070 [Polyangiaceae bacterium]